jgi:hypothetical protein
MLDQLDQRAVTDFLAFDPSSFMVHWLRGVVLAERSYAKIFNVKYFIICNFTYNVTKFLNHI